MSTPKNLSDRRRFLKTAAAAWVIMQTHPVLAITPPKASKKLIWVMLRGAMDGLHSVVPIGDPYLAALRAPLLSGIQEHLLPLNIKFALHPDLPFLHTLYAQKEMSPIVAVASAYRERSHFDAQDQMESGLNVTNHDSGWLSRALQEYNGSGVAISRSVPIALRGNSHAETWYPSVFPEADEDVLTQLQHLYKKDSALNTTLSSVIAQKANPAMQMQEKQNANFEYLSQRCGELLANDKHIQCAMLEFGGWDTHNNQQNRLSRQFKQLDAGLSSMKKALGHTWQDTLVIVTTEFGRTVAINGTQGTDHGTASSMFVAGGALASINTSQEGMILNGGTVLGDWPGLAPEQLFENRDLQPTSDIRSWISLALQAHWGLSSAQLKRVFPDI